MHWYHEWAFVLVKLSRCHITPRHGSPRLTARGGEQHSVVSAVWSYFQLDEPVNTGTSHNAGKWTGHLKSQHNAESKELAHNTDNWAGEITHSLMLDSTARGSCQLCCHGWPAMGPRWAFGIPCLDTGGTRDLAVAISQTRCYDATLWITTPTSCCTTLKL